MLENSNSGWIGWILEAGMRGSVGFLVRSGLKLPDFLQGGVFFEVSDLSRKRFKVLPVLFRVFFNRFNGRNGYAICLTPFHRVFIRQIPDVPRSNRAIVTGIDMVG